MLRKYTKRYLSIMLFGLMAFNAQAATVIPPQIWLVPSNSNINVGDVLTFDMYVNAASVGGLLGGGLDLFYNDTMLTYNGDFAFDSGFGTDPSFSRTGDDCATSMAAGCTATGEINGIAFGDFYGLGDLGDTLVGSLSFTGASPGSSSLTMADNDTPAGTWFNTAGDQINTLNPAGMYAMAYAISNVTVSPAVVPVPAAVWLFGSGLLGLAGVARRRGQGSRQ